MKQLATLPFVILLSLILSIKLIHADKANIQGSFAGYFLLTELETYMNSVKIRMKDLATTPTSIGTTNQNRKILSMCLGQCNQKHVPAMLYTGLHHAREPMGMMSVVYTMEYIVSQYLMGDPSIAALLEARSMWFIPAVNPDGYESNRLNRPNGGGNQRKNSNNAGANKCSRSSYDTMGVDLNRNYATCWSGDCPTNHDKIKHSDCGSSKNQCDEDYRGSGVFSEPESRAIRDFVQRHSSSITTALNFHSFAQQVYMPYSCTKIISSESEKDTITMTRMAKEWGKTAGYIVDHVWNTQGGGLGYSAAGDATDWMLYAHGIFAMTPETGPKDAEIFKALGSNSMGDAFYEYGFWPPKQTIERFANATTLANIRMVWVSGPCYDIQNVNILPSMDHGNTRVVELEIMNVGVNDTTSTPLLVSIVELKGSSGSSSIKISDFNLLGESVKLEQPPGRNNVQKIKLIVEGDEEVFQNKDVVIIVGDEVTCAMNYVGKAKQTWKVTKKVHVRHCEVCKRLVPTLKPVVAAPSSSTKDHGGAGSGSGSGSSSRTENKTPSSFKVSSSVVSPSSTPTTPCGPVSGGDISVVPSPTDKKIDWTLLWVSIAALVFSGCSCGCFIMICVNAEGRKYSKLGRSPESPDLEGIEIGRYKDETSSGEDGDQ
jgi:hypothetical protein